MRKNIFQVLIVVSALLISLSCKKEDKPDEPNCLTCKAYNPNGTVAAEQKVCSEAESAAFRAANPTREIGCN